MRHTGGVRGRNVNSVAYFVVGGLPLLFLLAMMMNGLAHALRHGSCEGLHAWNELDQILHQSGSEVDDLVFDLAMPLNLFLDTMEAVSGVTEETLLE